MNTDIISKKEECSKKLGKLKNSFEFVDYIESKRYKKMMMIKMNIFIKKI